VKRAPANSAKLRKRYILNPSKNSGPRDRPVSELSV
jgi:hypothetical protein